MRLCATANGNVRYCQFRTKVKNNHNNVDTNNINNGQATNTTTEKTKLNSNNYEKKNNADQRNGTQQMYILIECLFCPLMASERRDWIYNRI